MNWLEEVQNRVKQAILQVYAAAKEIDSPQDIALYLLRFPKMTR